MIQRLPALFHRQIDNSSDKCHNPHRVFFCFRGIGWRFLWRWAINVRLNVVVIVHFFIKFVIWLDVVNTSTAHRLLDTNVALVCRSKFIDSLIGFIHGFGYVELIKVEAFFNSVIYRLTNCLQQNTRPFANKDPASNCIKNDFCSFFQRQLADSSKMLGPTFVIGLQKHENFVSSKIKKEQKVVGQIKFFVLFSFSLRHPTTVTFPFSLNRFRKFIDW